MPPPRGLSEPEISQAFRIHGYNETTIEQRLSADKQVSASKNHLNSIKQNAPTKSHSSIGPFRNALNIISLAV
jgi:hypothetical protein